MQKRKKKKKKKRTYNTERTAPICPRMDAADPRQFDGDEQRLARQRRKRRCSAGGSGENWRAALENVYTRYRYIYTPATAIKR